MLRFRQVADTKHLNKYIRFDVLFFQKSDNFREKKLNSVARLISAANC